MNIDTLVSELEKDHQKKIDKVRKDLAFENWKDRQEHLEFVKSVWACMTIIDPWYVGLFEHQPDEKAILRHLRANMKELKHNRRLIAKTLDAFKEVYGEEISGQPLPKVAEKAVTEKLEAEDKAQLATDDKVKIIEKTQEILTEKKERIETAEAINAQAKEEVAEAIDNLEVEKAQIKIETLEKEKK